MDWKAERARAEDLAAGLELIRQAGLPVTDVAERFGHFFVVRDEGRLVGIGGLEIHGENGLLRSVVVEPAYRGQGLGTMLVEALLELARINQLASLYLLAETAREFFVQRGFEDCPREAAPPGIRESWELQTGCPASAAFMTRRLAPSTR
jgi:amino-acid N-acetyltransferase